MNTSRPRFTFRDVVLVADVFEVAAPEPLIHERKDLEMTDAETLLGLRAAIGELGLKVHHYDGPNALARNATRHTDDIVLSIYGGQASRNRMALVPAVCETFGLRFIGPDVYGRIIAQDKEISKRLALECGLKTPAWRVVRDERYLSRAFGLKFPTVVKPLIEGSSIGISQRNRASTQDDALQLTRQLLSHFRQPVLVEEFIAGREVSYCSVQGARDTAWAFSEVVIEGDPTFFQTRLFDAHEKLFRTPGRTVRNIDDELATADRERLEQLLTMLGTYGYCRVDGRLANDGFYFLELTPDAWLGQRGQFAMGFTAKSWTYTEVIAAVLASAN
jgi:D-alanine-D-alanine ligase